jgi:hypothetical protein
MEWAWWTLGVVAYVGLWICGAARYTSAKPADDVVRSLGMLLPAFSLATLAALFAVGAGRHSVVSSIALWLHHGAMLLLFLFLTATQYLLTEAGLKIRNRHQPASVAATYRRLWIFTETIPAPVALAIFLTGLRLIWEAPAAHSATASWVLILLTGFSVFFFDGILGYRPIVRGLYRQWQSHDAIGWSPPPPTPWQRVQLCVHFASFPPLFVVGLLRWSPPNPLASQIAASQQALTPLPEGWPEVITSVLVFAAVGAIVITVRVVTRQFETTFRERSVSLQGVRQ